MNNNTMQRIEEIDAKIMELEREKQKIKESSFSYFIMKEAYGDYDYWDDYYYCLGKMSRSDAERIVNDELNRDSDIRDADCFEVSETEYTKYCRWQILEEGANLDKRLKNLPGYSELMESINKEIDEILLELNLYKSFSHMAGRYIEHDR